MQRREQTLLTPRPVFGTTPRIYRQGINFAFILILPTCLLENLSNVSTSTIYLFTELNQDVRLFKLQATEQPTESKLT